MNVPSDPVGFFDSGLGGLSVRAAFRRLAPHESTVYLADSANCPYGNRPPEEIRARAFAVTRRLLFDEHAKMIVVACNTATAAAIDALRAAFPETPFIGLEPAVKPAACQSKSGVVGVLATAGTFNGRLYNETKAKFARGITVLATVADEFVTLVERAPLNAAGEVVAPDGPDVEQLVRAKVEPLLAAGADHLVLGCTHFPHLKPVIERVAAGRAVVLDPSEAVARQAIRRLAACHLVASESQVPVHRLWRDETLLA